MKKLGLTSALFLTVFLFVSVASAATVNVFVQPSGDVVSDRYWGYFGSGSGTIVGADPNSVSHRYEPGDGYWTKTSLTFDLPDLLFADEILSATFNYNVLSVHTEGRDDIGSFSGGGSVLFSNGTGWQYFDITDNLKSLIPASTVTYTLNYTGYSGFTFGSAEGGSPAYLSITTSSPVPVPGASWLLGSGLILLAGAGRRKNFNDIF